MLMYVRALQVRRRTVTKRLTQPLPSDITTKLLYRLGVSGEYHS